MAIHYCINPDVVASTTWEKAWLDVSGEPASANVNFTVYEMGPAPPPVPVAVPMNAANFATSPELFARSNGKTALVVAETSTRTNPSVAVLRANIGPVREALAIPPSTVMMGLAFNMPLFDPNGILYVGNPNNTLATVDVCFGSQANPPVQSANVDPTNVAKITLPASPTQTNLIVRVTNGVPVIVQAVLGNRFLVVYPI